ncbi:fructosamine kinase family protein [Mucilaginibacter gossypii]|uniref:fructosamine kinase family protein n=1 Tax=Mucilaginibacter gossypii TaxID=551996 RepID=UPI000DCCC299|nr:MULTISPECIES: fructosamine kinase family protein [Mucilaginibacter]QTE38346.1 fructosamine kinase family protein [Mucilaginibacter gossypii]RAV52180.1 fructosamine kinase [Mucilaginibacter rubeus]
MAVSASIISDIERKLNAQIKNVSPISGGDINQAYCLQTTLGDFFIKINSLHKFPGMFKSEESGLAAIHKTNTIAVPEVVLQGDTGDESYLMLQWIEAGYGDAISSQKLGRQLALMHRDTAAQFGFEADNYMGSLHQSNNRHNSWARFFIEERLQPMVKMAVDKRELTQTDIHQFDQLYKKLPGLFTEEPPALLHGDFWGGNYLIDTSGKPYLIDPAVSYGNREFDIAMTTLFGGFDRAFYEAYNQEFPLRPGWQQRLKLWNLYPLLVHVNLFGSMYTRQAKENLSAFI